MNKLLIALVEDDADDRDFVSSTILKNKDLEIKAFSTGVEFLEFMNSATRFPDLIITDIRMPLITGFDVINALKAKASTKDITIVVLSTSGHEEDIKRAKSLGVAGYYIKPYTLKEYEAITEKIVNTLNKGFISFSALSEEFLKPFLSFLLVELLLPESGEKYCKRTSLVLIGSC